MPWRGDAHGAIGSAAAVPARRRHQVRRASPSPHQNGAFGKKYLPETLGAGVAFLDYNNDGRQDILFVNGTTWPGQPHPAPSYSRLYRNDGDGRFTDVTAAAGLDVEMYGMGVAAAISTTTASPTC